MQWSHTDIEQYREAKEYIDTLFMPLIPFQLSTDRDLAKHAFQAEAITIFLNELEKELKGRALLTPAYTYLAQASKADESNRLNSWIKDISEQPFEHYFLFTHDATWKKYERQLNGTLIWIPSTASGDMQSPEFVQLIREQIIDISELIRSYW